MHLRLTTAPPLFLLGLLLLAVLFVWLLRWFQRERDRAGADAWRDMRAGLGWDSTYLERDTVRLLALRTNSRSDR